MRIPLLILWYLKIAIAEEDNKKLKTFELGVVAFNKRKEKPWERGWQIVRTFLCDKDFESLIGKIYGTNQQHCLFSDMNTNLLPGVADSNCKLINV